MISLPKLFDFRHSIGAILSVMPDSRKLEYLEIQRERKRLCKVAMEDISPGWKMNFQNSGKLGQYECNNIYFTTI
jgi:hypothetical protein